VSAVVSLRGVRMSADVDAVRLTRGFLDIAGLEAGADDAETRPATAARQEAAAQDATYRRLGGPGVVN
jgi:hypothetical protein